MDELFDPPTSVVRQYWAYTARINSLFRKHDRVKVLQFDRAYRMKQAEYGCPWGIDMNWLVEEHLGEASFSKSDQSPSQPPERTHRRRQLPQVCQQFNRVTGCKFGTRCIFKHQCEDCYGSHPKFIHTPPSSELWYGPANQRVGRQNQHQPNPSANNRAHTQQNPHPPSTGATWSQSGSQGWHQAPSKMAGTL